MPPNNVQKFFFHLASLLTTFLPLAGARFLDGLVHFLVGNRLLEWVVSQGNRLTARRVPRPWKILVLSDIHIGDAVMMQGAVQAFRDLFPRARVDYAVKKTVRPILEGNPVFSNLYPLFTSALFPESSDLDSLRKLAGENRYDLCFNGSPFFQDGRVFPQGQDVLNFMTVAPQLVRNDKEGRGMNHFLFQAYRFVEELFKPGENSRPPEPFRGVQVTLSDAAFEQAKDWLGENGLKGDRPLVFLNPDTASPYTLVPLGHQVALLKDLVEMDCDLLLGTAFTFRGIEKELLDSLGEPERRRIIQVPSTLPLEAYAVLLDFVDVFLTGDTGPLHIAAARKVSRSGRIPFRNRTFVAGLFGATPARMSGYDSSNPLFPRPGRMLPRAPTFPGAPAAT